MNMPGSIGGFEGSNLTCMVPAQLSRLPSITKFRNPGSFRMACQDSFGAKWCPKACQSCRVAILKIWNLLNPNAVSGVCSRTLNVPKARSRNGSDLVGSLVSRIKLALVTCSENHSVEKIAALG